MAELFANDYKTYAILQVSALWVRILQKFFIVMHTTERVRSRPGVPVILNSIDSFSSEYDEARAKFLAEATRAGAKLESIRHPESGPAGQPLFVDVAHLGPAEPEAMLVLISATHGVEGFCGSGAQVDFLRRGEHRRLPQGTALLLIHAINPYGFAWLRRVTHENIDLNRNWVDFDAPLPVNPEYAALADAIVPKRWDDASLAEASLFLDAYIQRHGADALNQVMSTGQYSHPHGIFYGGSKPSWSRQAQTQILQTYASKCPRVAIVDYHTGLGPWGYAEPISTSAPTSEAFLRVRNWYGLSVKSTVDGTSVGARVGGDGISAAARLLPQAEITAVAFEVGTIDRNEVRLAVRADTWLHTYGDPVSPQGQAIKAAIRRAYYGDAGDWKGMVAGQSLTVCRQALAGLNQPASRR